MSVRGSGTIPKCPKQQADAAISQANPVSATLYTVLDTTKNVRVYGIAANITWAVTQPTPLDVVLTIDGRTINFTQANPVTATYYEPYMRTDLADASHIMAAVNSFNPYKSFMVEGRSVKIEVKVTWAVTQPTPLVCRVKWAKW